MWIVKNYFTISTKIEIESKKWNEIEWNEKKWNEMIWYDMIWYDMIWYDMIWNEMKWNENIYNSRREVKEQFVKIIYQYCSSD